MRYRRFIRSPLTPRSGLPRRPAFERRFRLQLAARLRRQIIWRGPIFRSPFLTAPRRLLTPSRAAVIRSLLSHSSTPPSPRPRLVGRLLRRRSLSPRRRKARCRSRRRRRIGTGRPLSRLPLPVRRIGRRRRRPYLRRRFRPTRRLRFRLSPLFRRSPSSLRGRPFARSQRRRLSPFRATLFSRHLTAPHRPRLAHPFRLLRPPFLYRRVQYRFRKAPIRTPPLSRFSPHPLPTPPH